MRLIILYSKVVIIAILFFGCSSSRSTYHAIAEQWAISLNKYIENPTNGNHQKLKSICSDYTGSLIKNEKWLDTFCSKPTGVKFKYQFIKDSLSSDKTRAYVWYRNENDRKSNKLRKIALRQSLNGWVVDMPLM